MNPKDSMVKEFSTLILGLVKKSISKRLYLNFHFDKII